MPGKNQTKTKTVETIKVEKVSQESSLDLQKSIILQEPPTGDALIPSVDQAPAADTAVIKEKTDKKLKSTAAKVVREIKDVKPAVTDPETEERDRVARAIASYHEQLEGAEAVVFKKYSGKPLTKTKYASVGQYRRNARINAAKKREANAEKVERFLRDEYTAEVEYEDIHDSEMLKEKIDEFLNEVPDAAMALDTDENFARTLKSNYTLTMLAARMKKYVSDAVEGGYLPAGVNMKAIQKKIAGFEELKKYLDIRTKIVTSPYYKYCASEDVNYTDEQLDDFIRTYNISKDEAFKERNRELIAYLENIRTFRKVKLNRKKGLASVKELAEERAKHEVEILKTRAEKREIINKLTEAALREKQNDMYHDPEYDDRYTREKLNESIAALESVKLSELHFGSLKDMTDHWEENERQSICCSAL